jgi:peptidoglycan/LPS O-acetylase OafA/YrhL
MSDTAPAVPLPDLARTPVRRLHALTTLRFFAAAAIVLNHSANVGLIPPNLFGRFLLFQAVSFFFVLSGFILAYVYPHLETSRARGRFLLARFARVWPAHVTTLLLTFLLVSHPLGYPSRGPLDFLLALALNLAMLQSWVPLPRAYLSFNAVSWSISTEFAFYLFFPLLIHRWSRTWWWKLPLTALAAAAMILLAQRPGLPLFAEATPDMLDRVTVVGLVYTFPLARLFEFALGMSVALLWRKTSARTLSRPLATLLELAALALLLANMHAAAPFAAWAKSFPGIGDAGEQWLQEGGSVCLAFAFLILVIAREEGWIARLLSAPLGVLLGEISYSVYLMHQMLIQWRGHHADRLAAVPPWLVYSVYWLLVLLSSFVIWAAVERPLRKWIVQGFPAWRRAAPTPRTESRQALELPGGRARSAFAPLLDPTPRVIAAAALLLALLCAGIMANDQLAARARRRALASLLPERALPDSRYVRFGDEFLLAGARFTPRPGGGLDLTLHWLALKNTTRHYQIAIHLLNADRIVAQADYPQDNRPVRVNDTWTDTVPLPPEKLQRAADVGIAIPDGAGHALPADTGPRDLANHRLRLPLPAATRP